MTPQELTAARKALRLTSSGLGRALEMTARDPGRSVREWEKGTTSIPGPVAVALRYMLREKLSEKAQEAAQAVQAVTLAANSLEPVPEPPEATVHRVITTRRRGA
jgi:hypothetical protein